MPKDRAMRCIRRWNTDLSWWGKENGGITGMVDEMEVHLIVREQNRPWNSHK